MAEPISMLLASAIASGAATALKDTAAQAIKDAYSAVKTFIAKRYSHVDPAVVEHDPESTARQGVLSEDLEKSGADRDGELRKLVDELLKAIQQNAPAADRPAGLDVDALRAKLLTIGAVNEGTGVRARTADIEEIRIDNIGKKK